MSVNRRAARACIAAVLVAGLAGESASLAASDQGSDTGAEHAVHHAFKHAKGVACLRTGPAHFRCAFVIGPDEEGEVGIARLSVSIARGRYYFGTVRWEWKPCAEVPNCPTGSR